MVGAPLISSPFRACLDGMSSVALYCPDNDISLVNLTLSHTYVYKSCIAIFSMFRSGSSYIWEECNVTEFQHRITNVPMELGNIFGKFGNISELLLSGK